jgi:UDP-N-acetylmuramoylalanine--D-glutamate ligase
VAVIAGVTYYNDSKATNEGATVSAVRSMSKITNGAVVVILGGRAKQDDFSSLFGQLQGVRYKVILIGESAALIKSFVPEDITVVFADSLTSAVEQAKAISIAEDIVLLSPACASFDMFDSFEQRGDIFKQSVLNLTSGIDDKESH